MHYVEQASAIL